MKTTLYQTLLATAVGDAYGLPYENLSPRRAKKWLRPRRYALLPFIHGGMVSDDTEHAVLTVQAYIASAGEPSTFRRKLRGQLRGWLLALPVNCGMATLKGCLKICLGLQNTGTWSAGNGATMRAPVLGILCKDVNQLAELIHISTATTHSDPQAEHAAYALALLAHAEYYLSNQSVEQKSAWLGERVHADLWAHIHAYQPDPKHGITGYAYHTVAAVFQAWQQFRDNPLAGLDFLCECGGDTDTTCALFAGVVGGKHGATLFDEMAGAWCEPVLRPDFFEQLAEQAARVAQTRQPEKPVRWGGVRTILRNALFVVIVLAHGLRRLLPPY